LAERNLFRTFAAREIESRGLPASCPCQTRSRINLDYAQKDMKRANEERIKLLYKYDVLTQQLAKAF
jgi:hypothetical protein